MYLPELHRLKLENLLLKKQLADAAYNAALDAFRQSVRKDFPDLPERFQVVPETGEILAESEGPP